jgi:hypothetical protein
LIKIFNNVLKIISFLDGLKYDKRVISNLTLLINICINLMDKKEQCLANTISFVGIRTNTISFVWMRRNNVPQIQYLEYKLEKSSIQTCLPVSLNASVASLYATSFAPFLKWLICHPRKLLRQDNSCILNELILYTPISPNYF